MYLLEGDREGTGFSSIPRSMYWSIVTMTTVGYGDIAPVTLLGQTLAAVLMIMGYGIIAVPTGIVSIQMAKSVETAATVSTQACPDCSREGHDIGARYCKFCGAAMGD